MAINKITPVCWNSPQIFLAGTGKIFRDIKCENYFGVEMMKIFATVSNHSGLGPMGLLHVQHGPTFLDLLSPIIIKM